MKFPVISLATALALVASGAFAADTSKTAIAPDTAKPAQFVPCLKQARAKNLQGDAYQTFMRTCRAENAKVAANGNSDAAMTRPPVAIASNPSPERAANQQKFRECVNQAKAKGLKGPERRTFMQTCRKGDGKSESKPAPAR